MTSSIAGRFGTLGAFQVETDIDHIDVSLEALAERMTEFAVERGLTTFQLIVLVDPSAESAVAH